MERLKKSIPAAKVLSKVANDIYACVNIEYACSNWSSVEFNGLSFKRPVAYEEASHSEFSDFRKVAIACPGEREIDRSDRSDSVNDSNVISDQSDVRCDDCICKNARKNDPPSEPKIDILEIEPEAQIWSGVGVLSVY